MYGILAAACIHTSTGGARQCEAHIAKRRSARPTKAKKGLSRSMQTWANGGTGEERKANDARSEEEE